MGVATAVRSLNPRGASKAFRLDNARLALRKHLPAINGLNEKKLFELKKQFDSELDKIKPSLFYLGSKILEFNKNSPIRQVFIDDTHGRLLGVFVHKILETAEIPHRAIYLNIPRSENDSKTSQDFLEQLRGEVSKFTGHSIFVTDMVSSAPHSALAVECLSVAASHITIISAFFSGRQAMIDLNSRWRSKKGIWEGSHTQQSLFDRFTCRGSCEGVLARKQEKLEGYQALSQPWLHHRRDKNLQNENELHFISYSRTAIEKLAQELVETMRN